MGFLHKIWDDTLAGPAPDSGLGKLRKYDSFSGTRSASAPPVGVAAPPNDDGGLIPISRSITVVRTNGHSNLTVSVDSPSTPSSPDGSTTPRSPFSPSMPGGNVKKFIKRKPKGPKSPTGYDWIVLSALDR